MCCVSVHPFVSESVQDTMQRKSAFWHRDFRRQSFRRVLRLEDLEGRFLMAGDVDDAISEAISMGVASTTPRVANDAISPDTDVDMYSLAVSAGQTIDFDADTLENGPNGLGTYFRLFNANGQQLAFNNDAAAPGENVVGFDAYLRFTFAASGTYYLGVSNANNTNYNSLTGDGDAAGGQFAVGNYKLTIQALPIDPDDTLNEAPSLGLISTMASVISAAINPDIDVDIVSFSVTDSQTVDFDIDTQFNGPGGLGSYLRVFNGQGQQLARNDDGVAPGETALGFDSYLRYTFGAGGIYYVAVSNNNNVNYNPISGANDAAGGQHSIGEYTLRVQTPPPAPVDTDDSISESFSLGQISTIASTTTATVNPDVDVDMFRFDVTAGMVVDFDIDTTLNGAGGLGSFLRLFNVQGTELAFNDDGIAPGENVLGFDAYLRFRFTTAGTYYLGVSNFNNTLYNPITGGGDAAGGQHATGDYKLTVQALPVDTDDALVEANSLGQITAAPITRSESISPDIDVDLYSFQVASGQILDFDIDTAINGFGGLGSYLRLFNAQGRPLASNDNGVAPGETTLGFDAYLRFTFASAGTYFIGVSNGTNVTYDPTTGNGDTAGGLHSIGDYTLIVQTPAPAPVDSDDSIAESVSLGTVTTTPTTINGNITPDVDVDMYGFTVAAGQSVDFDIDTALNGIGGLSSYLRLFNFLGQELAANNNGTAPGEETLGFDAYLRFTFTAAGTYYIAVSNSSNVVYDPLNGGGDTAGGAGATGAYQLTLQALPVDPDDTIVEATALGAISTRPITTSASISPDVDVDVYSFSVITGQIVDFDIDTALNGPNGLGSYLRLFTAQGQQLAVNNDAAAPGENTIGFDAYLRYSFATGGTYYIAVSNSRNTSYNPVSGAADSPGGPFSIGDYQLIIQSPAAAPIDTDDSISESLSLGQIGTTSVVTSGTISPSTDVDMYRFSVTTGQVVDFDIDTAINGLGGLGSFLRLFNAQGQVLALNNDASAPGEGAPGFDAYLRYTFAAAGRYYIGVSNSNNTTYDPVTGSGDTEGGVHATGDYQLTVQALPVDTDDTFVESNPLGQITAAPISTSATINPDVDVDMYRFTVSAGQVVNFDIDTLTNGPGGLGSYLRLFNSTGQQLAFNDNASAPSEGAVGFDAYLQYTFATTGTYYIGVSNSYNATYDPTTGNADTAGGLNSIGDYLLIVQTAPIPAEDLDDAIAEAPSIGQVTTNPNTTSASINPDTDVDMLSFTVAAGQTVDFDIDTSANGPGGLGSYLRLFNAQGQQLASNDNASAPGEGAVGFDAYLRFTFTTAGTYYIAVSNSGNINYDAVSGGSDTAGAPNALGAYTLSIQLQPSVANPTLSLSSNISSIPEIGGQAAATVVRHDADISQPLIVNITSSNTNSASVPPTVTIPANQSSATFIITAVHDMNQSTRSVIITASSTGLAPATLTLTIVDSDGSGHNPNLPADTNGDGGVTPIDALLVINYLNTVGPGPVPSGNSPPFLDVNADGFVTAIDALLVINQLNLRFAGEGEALYNAGSTSLASPAKPEPSSAASGAVQDTRRKRWVNAGDSYFGIEGA